MHYVERFSLSCSPSELLTLRVAPPQSCSPSELLTLRVAHLLTCSSFSYILEYYGNYDLWRPRKDMNGLNNNQIFMPNAGPGGILNLAYGTVIGWNFYTMTTDAVDLVFWREGTNRTFT